MAALLSASAVRIDVAGTPAVDGLSFETTGDRVVVLGAARALFEAVAGLRTVTRGDILVDGQTPHEAVRSLRAAGAPLDPPLPPAWTVAEYVEWSARLTGRSRRDANRSAGSALEALQLASSASTKLRNAGASMRRATVLAAALATGAPVVFAEDPTSDLPDDAARSFGRIVARALSTRRVVLFSARLGADSPFVLGSDEGLVIEGSAVMARAAPSTIIASTATWVVRLVGDVGAFVRHVEDAGAHVEVVGSSSPPAYVRVELGGLAARDLFRIAATARATVVELHPVARGFA